MKRNKKGKQGKHEKGGSSKSSSSSSSSLSSKSSKKNKKLKSSSVASRINPAWLVFIIVVVLAVGIVIRQKVIKGSSSASMAGYKSPSAYMYTSEGEHDLVPASKWEPDFQSSLWTQDGMKAVKSSESNIFARQGAYIKSVGGRDAPQEMRVLVFDDTATEIQGVALFENGVHNPSHLVLEYIRTMALALGFMHRDHSCAHEGRALVVGLGAGTLANFVHAKFPNYHIDVAEVSQDVYDANIEVMGTVEDDKMKVHLKDAGEIFIDNDSQYDIIFLDAYLPGPEIPPQLLKQQWVNEVRSHLSERGVLVFNFCTSFYSTPAAKQQVLQPLMNAFDHVHLVESTWQSKIVVAYHSRERVTREQWHYKYNEWVEAPRCLFPRLKRGAGYEVYLSDDPHWVHTFSRNLHREATEKYCREGKVSETYCEWFSKNSVHLYPKE